MQANETRGLWLGFLGVAMFALGIPMLRLAVGPNSDPQLTPQFVAAGRAACAGLMSLLYLYFSSAPRLQRRDISPLIVSALGTVVGFPLFASMALRHVDAMHAVVVSGLLPLATAVIAALHLRQRPSFAFWTCSMLGCAIVLTFAAHEGNGTLSPADGLLVLAVVSSAIGYVAPARVYGKLPAEQVICWVLVLSLPLTIPATLISWPDAPVSLSAWGGLAYNAVFAVWLAYFAWYKGLALGGTVRVSQVQLVQPFIALLCAVPLLGERLELHTVAYSLAIIAIVLVSRKTTIDTSARTASTLGVQSSRARPGQPRESE